MIIAYFLIAFLTFIILSVLHHKYGLFNKEDSAFFFFAALVWPVSFFLAGLASIMQICMYIHELIGKVVK